VLQSCVLQTNLMRSIYLQSFMLIPLIVLELCSGQSSKSENKQRGIIKKLGKAELRFLCTAHLHNEIYLPTKIHVDISCKMFQSYVPDKKSGRTDRRMDGQVGDYMLPPNFFFRGA
jgi:hypothetical protein